MSTESCIYEGHVRHRRFESRSHGFTFPLFMMYVDLDEVDSLFRKRWFWSAARFNLAWFRRSDHLGPPEKPLSDSVRDLVARETGTHPTGSIRLLTHFRYFGYLMNPISIYYCFDESRRLEFVVAEVTNTPWGERHNYVIDVRSAMKGASRPSMEKAMHVSPFFGMNYHYRFSLAEPGEKLSFGIGMFSNTARPETPTAANKQDRPAPAFHALLHLRRRALTGSQLARVLLRYPLMTVQVFAGIYWQAVRLWWKKIPYFPNPSGRQFAGSPASAGRLPASRQADNCNLLLPGSGRTRS